MIQVWCVAAVITILVVAVCVVFVDKPIASLSYRVIGHLIIVQEFAGTPSFFGPLEIVILAIFLLRRITLYQLAHADAVLVLCEASLLATKLSVSQMKYAFGRTWPLHGHPSFLIDGAYGFNFFTSGRQFEAFPSGHTASICALASVLWMTYPRFRPLYAAGAAGMAIALVAGDFHFLSDVLAGGFLGISIALLAFAAWRFGKRKQIFSAAH